MNATSYGWQDDFFDLAMSPLVDAAQALVQLLFRLLRLDVRLPAAATVVDPRVVGQARLHCGAALHAVGLEQPVGVADELQSGPVVVLQPVADVQIEQLGGQQRAAVDALHRPTDGRQCAPPCRRVLTNTNGGRKGRRSTA